MTAKPADAAKSTAADTSHDAQHDELAAVNPAEAKKNRPTPTRKQAEAANRKPLVAGDRKAAAKARRAKTRELRDREYQALKTNDERNLPARDRGPVKRYIRDFVDARWNVGEYFLFIAFALLAFSIITMNWIPLISVTVMAGIYLVIFAAIIDTVIMWRQLKRRLTAKFGEVAVIRGSGSAMYACQRAFQIRRSRLPKPRSKQHGNFPD